MSLHRKGMMAMLRTLRGPLLHGGAVTFPFWSRARPEKPITLLSGLFHAPLLDWGAQLFLFASDGCDGYATWAAGPTFSWVVGFLPAPLEAGECSTLRPFCCSPAVLTPQDRSGVPPTNFRIILRDHSCPVVGLPLLDRGPDS